MIFLALTQFHDQPSNCRRDFNALRLAALMFVGTLISASGIGVVAQDHESTSQSVAGSVAQEDPELALQTAELLVRLNDPRQWPAAFEMAETFGTKHVQRCWDVIESAWRTLDTDGKKLGMMNAAVQSAYPYAHRVIHLGMTDPSLKIQNRAIDHVRRLALFDAALDFQAYLSWYQSAQNKSRTQIHREGLTRVIESLRTANQNSDLLEMHRLVEFVEQRRLTLIIVQSAEAAGTIQAAEWYELLVDVLSSAERLMREDPEDEKLVMRAKDTIQAVGRILQNSDISDELIQAKILPLTYSEPGQAQSQAILLLAKSKQQWAFDRLCELVIEQGNRSPSDDLNLSYAARALGALGDPRAIPILIGVIDADNSSRTIYGTGYFGLQRLTEVEYDAMHHGPWWRAWWKQNRSRFPPEVQALDIPDFPKTEAGKAFEARRKN